MVVIMMFGIYGEKYITRTTYHYGLAGENTPIRSYQTPDLLLLSHSRFLLYKASTVYPFS